MLAPADSEHQNAASSPGNQNSDRPPQSDLAKIHPVLPASNALILYNASSLSALIILPTIRLLSIRRF
jgi:hypothetical protein